MICACLTCKGLTLRLLAAIAIAALMPIALTGPAGAKRHRGAERVETAGGRPIGAPLLAIVSLSNQRITIYDGDGWILRAPVSTGQTGYETPAGIYSVLQKEEEHYSNLYDDASMPFMQRITWSGIALHAGLLPGYPASHGCVRMPHEFAELLFEITSVGMRVIVARTDVRPARIDHPALFQPKRIRAGSAVESLAAHWDAARAEADAAAAGAEEPHSTPPPASPEFPLVTWKAIAEAKSAEAETAARKAEAARINAARMTMDAARLLRAAEAAKARAAAHLRAAEAALASANSPAAIQQAEIAKNEAAAKFAAAETQLAAAKAEAPLKMESAARAREEAQAAEAARAAALKASLAASYMTAPITVFVSRKTQRLYVRQSFEQVFESAVTIRDPDQPIGTHIFTALGYTNADTGIAWNAVSMPATTEMRPPAPIRNPGRDGSGDDNGEPMAWEAGQAWAALGRIEIPKKAAARISEVISPGSTLIISDEGMSAETGEGTDFVIVMSGEPQGAIKRRRRDPQAYRHYSSQSHRAQRRGPAYAPSYDGNPFFPW
ncbi:MAG: L,D-transpeptidase family protein [Beijerinckiaceae bacterium]|nr:L,D-transpeptidase family protein [Beijerinckiaceae bacterium]